MARLADKAVILAAGQGNRMGGSIPKPLLPLSGKPGDPCFLDWHLWHLHRCGVREIYLVGNDVTFGTQLQAMQDVPATWILNPSSDLSRSGSGHSAHIAFNDPATILDGRSSVLLMDADIVYEAAVLDVLAQAPQEHSCTLVCTRRETNNEEILVFAATDAPALALRHGKGLYGTPLVRGLDCLGEATGIVRFAAADHADILAISEWLMTRSTAKTRNEHEDLTQQLMHLRRIHAVTFRDFLFMEVDTPEDHATMRRDLLPRLPQA